MDNIHNPPLLSVHILLPEAIDRRLERRTREMAGASWPAWGGHITLVPKFVSRDGVAEAQVVIETLCADQSPFMLHFASPVAVQDKTRAEYFALFLTVEAHDGDEDADKNDSNTLLMNLRENLLLALEPLRQDLHPELVVQPFLPHVTLALGVSESEARSLVRGLRAEPFEAEFWVDEIWLLVHSTGDSARLERIAVPLGRTYHDAVLLD